MVGCVVCLLHLAIPTDVRPSSPDGADSARVVRIGLMASVFQGVNLKDARAAIEIYVRSFARDLGSGYVPGHFFFGNLGEVRASLLKGEVDVLQLSSLEYLLLSERWKLEPIAAGSVDGTNPMAEYVLLRRTGEAVGGLSDLEGGRISIGTKDDGSLARLWLDNALMEAGLVPASSHFQEVKVVAKSPQAILPVFFGQLEACIVTERAFSTMIELNPQVGDRLEVSLRSEPLLPSVVVFPDSIEPAMRSFLRSAILGLHEHVAGRQSLALFGISRLSPVNSSHFASVASLRAINERLRAGMIVAP